MIYEEGYQTIQGYECLNSCISNYLNFANIPISGSDIFFLGNGFATDYRKRNGEKQLRTKVYEANYTFLDKFYIPYTHDYFYGKDREKDFLKQQMEEKGYISLRVVSRDMTYHPLFKQAQNAPHFINVIGYNEKTSQFYISDGSIPAYQPDKFEGWVDEEEVLDGWFGANLEYVILHLDESWNKELSWKGLSRIATELAICDYLEFKKSRGIFSKTAYGRRAVKELFIDVARKFESSGDGFREYALRLNYQWKVYGFLSARRYLLQKMEEIGISETLTKPYGEVITEWSNIGLALIKLSVAKKAGLMEKTIEKAEATSEKENSLLARLLETI
jgi:hypothetical protein